MHTELQRLACELQQILIRKEKHLPSAFRATRGRYRSFHRSSGPLARNSYLRTGRSRRRIGRSRDQVRAPDGIMASVAIVTKKVKGTECSGRRKSARMRFATVVRRERMRACRRVW